jgi:hypothetical protein
MGFTALNQGVIRVGEKKSVFVLSLPNINTIRKEVFLIR